MSHIEMDYILIEKKSDEKKNVKQIVLEYLIQEGDNIKDDDIITNKGNQVFFKFEHKKGS